MTSHTVHTDIAYTTQNHHSRQVLDLHIPSSSGASSDHSSPKVPLILYIHGGAFKFGSKESQLLPLRQLNNGYAIAAINYRRSGEALFPAMIEDCKSALRFLKSPSVADKYGLDPRRVVVWGESAGGHAAAFLGTTASPTLGGRYDVGDNLDVSSSVVGVVDYYGPTDFLEMDSHLPDGYGTHNNIDSPESLYLGAQITTIPDKVKEANPCTYIEEMVERYRSSSDEECPKFFIAHGTADRVVPEYMSQLLREALAEKDVPYEYLPVRDTDHVFTGITEDQQKDLDEQTDAFLRRVFAVS